MTTKPGLLAADPPRRCRHCNTTAASCQTKHDYQRLSCCDRCVHDWEDR